MTTPTEPERTALYRCFDEDGALLYVGITNSPERRWYRHSLDSAWWPFAARKTIDWHPSRLDAAIAEAAAIGTESPRWNVAQPNPDDPLRCAGGMKSTGRPATGQTPVKSFRVDATLRADFKAKALAEGKTESEVLISLLHRYVSTPAKPPPPP